MLGDHIVRACHLAGRTFMDYRLKSYLRTHRRRLGFTQEELAFLLGVKSRTAISRIEGSKRKPSLDAVIVCSVLFNTSPMELFPELVTEQHEAILRRATVLYEQLQGHPSETARIKLDFLEQLVMRVEETARSEAI